jgi:hypothetical protein
VFPIIVMRTHKPKPTPSLSAKERLRLFQGHFVGSPTAQIFQGSLIVHPREKPSEEKAGKWAQNEGSAKINNLRETVGIHKNILPLPQIQMKDPLLVDGLANVGQGVGKYPWILPELFLGQWSAREKTA